MSVEMKNSKFWLIFLKFLKKTLKIDFSLRKIKKFLKIFGKIKQNSRIWSNFNFLFFAPEFFAKKQKNYKRQKQKIFVFVGNHNHNSTCLNLSKLENRFCFDKVGKQNFRVFVINLFKEFEEIQNDHLSNMK